MSSSAANECFPLPPKPPVSSSAIGSWHPPWPICWHNSKSMRILLVLVTALGLTAAGEMSLTVEKLTAFIRSAVQLKQPDRQVAEYLHHGKMVEKLDDRTVEELQGMGAGPKTVAALRELSEASGSLPVAPAPPPNPGVVPSRPRDS